MLYGVIFSIDPRDEIDQIVHSLSGRDDERRIIDEIDRELSEPSQRVSEIHDFVHSPSGQVLREFLRGVSETLKPQN